MTKTVVDLNVHRGTAVLNASDIQRQLLHIEDEQRALKSKQEALEIQLVASPSQYLMDAVDRARYLIGLLAQTSAGRDPRRKKLIASTLEDLNRFAGATGTQNA
ncbi:MAG: hypothetical protein ABL973_17735 [Micropepsaceae bacterium]